MPCHAMQNYHIISSGLLCDVGAISYILDGERSPVNAVITLIMDCGQGLDI